MPEAGLQWYDIPLVGLVANSKNSSDYVISKEVLSWEPYGIMYRKGRKAVVDETIAKSSAIPRFQTLYAKWFESAIPPRGVNLNWPMGDYLKHAIAHPAASADPADHK